MEIEQAQEVVKNLKAKAMSKGYFNTKMLTDEERKEYREAQQFLSREHIKGVGWL